jgi:ppGpp synthetase/RelA/SpoT-type nucleotidyltranferase
MPLTDKRIDECCSRYQRERARYLKMSETVKDKCQELLRERITIRAQVHYRAKSIESFRNKLIKNRKKYRSVDDVFDRFSDLSAVRVATYLESDREKVVEGIAEIFSGKLTEDPEIEVKNKDGKEGFHYRATHCQVYLSKDDIEGNCVDIQNTSCEIQVCSLLAHVFNEIEHDLQYKTLHGDLHSSEREFIDQLGMLTKIGDLTIKNLLSETEKRLEDRQGEFDDAFDFVARMKKELNFKVNNVHHAGQLYMEVKRLGLNSMDKIKESIGSSDEESLYDICKKEFSRIQGYCNKHSDKRHKIKEGSSDLLLAGLLKNNYQNILSRKDHESDGSQECQSGIKMNRLKRIAEYYKNMINSVEI